VLEQSPVPQRVLPRSSRASHPHLRQHRRAVWPPWRRVGTTTGKLS